MLAGLALALFLSGQQTARLPFEQGARAFGAGDFGRAERLLTEAVKAAPQSFDARFLLGATLAQLGRTDAAIVQLRAAHWLRPAHADALKLLATQYMAKGDYRAATTLLTPAASAAGDEEILLLLIESLATAGDTALSEAYARKALARFPNSPAMLCWMAFQAQFSGRFDEAARYLEKALRIAPGYPASYYLAADLRLKRQDAAGALPFFEKAIAASPGDVDARLGMTQALVELDRIHDALAALQQAARIAPEEARIHFQLSRLYFRLGDEKKAEEEAALSAKLRPEHPLLTAPPAALRSGNQ
jgi:tetratricopeptide (TPR) repeat protein